MAEKLDLDALGRIADQERWRGNRTDGEHFNTRMDYHNSTRPSTIYALINRIRELEARSERQSMLLRDQTDRLGVANLRVIELERASQPGSGEAVTEAMMVAGARSLIDGQEIRPGSSWAEEAKRCYEAMARASLDGRREGDRG